MSVRSVTLYHTVACLESLDSTQLWWHSGGGYDIESFWLAVHYVDVRGELISKFGCRTRKLPAFQWSYLAHSGNHAHRGSKFFRA